MWMALITLLAVVLAAYAGLVVFYWLFQERFIFIRFRVGDRYRFRFRHGLPVEEVYLDAPDGARLHALRFRVEAPRGLLLYYHGNTGSVRRWGRYAHRFTALGYEVLMPDPRGYGKSRGRLSERALMADAQQWYEHAKLSWPEEDIVVYGRSLGSGLATPVAANNRPRMLVLETPFANLYDVATHYLPILPYRLLLRYRFRNDRAIVRVQCPVYIFHGQRDTVVPYASALKLYAAVPAHVQREMFTFPKGLHSDLSRFARFNRLMRRILTGEEAQREA
ncbi:MAG TPA: alpha/beta hydrolase [Flavobacteriales bacterium]|nr:alpha/beta hydrolase [Flavobacteriales bacterium]